jgi:hypothetical protein
MLTGILPFYIAHTAPYGALSYDVCVWLSRPPSYTNRPKRPRRVTSCTKLPPVRETRSPRELFHIQVQLCIGSTFIGISISECQSSERHTRHTQCSSLVIPSHPPAENQRDILQFEAGVHPSISRLCGPSMRCSCRCCPRLIVCFFQLSAVAGIIITWLYLRATTCELFSGSRWLSCV